MTYFMLSLGLFWYISMDFYIMPVSPCWVFEPFTAFIFAFVRLCASAGFYGS
jgi:hypothetical protein